MAEMLPSIQPVVALGVALRIAVFLSVFPSVRSALRGAGIAALSLGFAVWHVTLASSPEDATSTAQIGERFPIVFDWMVVLIVVVSEAITGVIAAMPIALALEAAPLLGRLIDCVRGAQAGEMIAPLADNHGSLLEGAFRFASLALICEQGLSAVGMCAVTIRPTPARFPLRDESLLGYLDVQRLGLLFGEMLWVAAPLALALLAFDLFAGVLSRAGTQTVASLAGLRLFVSVLLWAPLAHAVSEVGSRVLSIETAGECVERWKNAGSATVDRESGQWAAKARGRDL